MKKNLPLIFDKTDIQYQVIENSIALKLRMDDFDGAIAECDIGLKLLSCSKPEDNKRKFKARYAMLCTNKGKALLCKIPCATTKDETEILCSNALKNIEKGLAIWIELEDQYNIAITKCLLADYYLTINNDINEWLKKYHEAIVILNDVESDQAKISIGDIMLRVVAYFCNFLQANASELINFTYETAQIYLSGAKEIYKAYCPLDYLRSTQILRHTCTLNLLFADGVEQLTDILKELKKVLKKLLQCAQLEESTKSIESSILDIYDNIGAVHYYLGQTEFDNLNTDAAQKHFKESLDFYKKGLRLSIKLYGEAADESTYAYLNISRVYLSLYKSTVNSKYLTNAIKCLEEQNEIISLKDNSLIYGEIMQILGKSHLYLSEYQISLKYLNKALVCYNSIGNEQDYPQIFYEVYRDFLMYYAKQGDLENALHYKEKAERILLDNGYDKSSKELILLNKLLEK